jgi:hypothetical protein
MAVAERAGDERAESVEMRLGTLLQLEAERVGRGVDWRPYVAGRLLLPPTGPAPFGLLAEIVPEDRTAAEAVAARWRLDPDVLWLVVTSAQELMATATQPAE